MELLYASLAWLYIVVGIIALRAIMRYSPVVTNGMFHTLFWPITILVLFVMYVIELISSRKKN